MKKFFGIQVVRPAVFTLLIVSAVLFVITPFSCRLTEEGIEIFPADTKAPSVENFSVTGASRLLISCSEKIVLDEICVLELDEKADSSQAEFTREADENLFAVANAITYSESRKCAEIELSAPTQVGKSYVFSGVIYDTTGNSLDFSQKFFGYNENPARLIFNEVRTTYSKAKMAPEYVEFYVLKGGNTFGLEMVSAANGEGKKYSFPSIEVKKGELITLHGRIVEGSEESAIDELGDELNLSLAPESSDSARDLWKAGDDKIASNNDVLLLRDGVSLEIKDALLLSASGKEAWSKKIMTEFAENAFNLGIWNGGCLPENAVCTDGMTSSLYRSISRQNTSELAARYADSTNLPDYIQTSPADWIVTDKYYSGKILVSGATPGYENSSNAYSAD